VPVTVVPPEGADGESYELQPTESVINPATTPNRSLILFSIRRGDRKGVATSMRALIDECRNKTRIHHAFFVSENSNSFLTA